jgi:hypothetical protein
MRQLETGASWANAPDAPDGSMREICEKSYVFMSVEPRGGGQSSQRREQQEGEQNEGGFHDLIIRSQL